MSRQLEADLAEARALVAYQVMPIEMELREAAAQRIEKVGWAQGNWVTRDGRISADEALIEVCRAVPLELFDATVWHLEREIGGDLALWQDAEGRTVEEVLAALRGTS
jgi:hypothetical protein